jgi:hypothetical protein
LKAELGFSKPSEEEESSSEAPQSTPQPTPILPRKRGRKKKVVPTVEEPVEERDLFPPAPLTRRDEKDVAKRLQQILLGVTGIGGVLKPYIPMTEEEAKAIADPLASFLIRNEPTNAIAKEIVENYDVLAILTGTGAYVTRVWHDRKKELEERQPPRRVNSALDRISELQTRDNEGRQDEGNGTFIDPSSITRSGRHPLGDL